MKKLYDSKNGGAFVKCILFQWAGGLEYDVDNRKKKIKLLKNSSASSNNDRGFTQILTIISKISFHMQSSFCKINEITKLLMRHHTNADTFSSF